MSMRSMSFVGFALIGMALAACSADKQSATTLISDIQGAVDAASADATKYVPEQLADVQSKFGALKADYDQKNYKAVVDGGQPVLSEAQGLESAATAKKELIARGFNDQWSALSNALPGNASAIQSRIDFLSKQENKKLATGVDLAEARSSLSDAEATWTKAQDAYSSGSLEQAVIIAKTVQGKLSALAASMKLDLSEPAQVTDTSS